MKHLGISVPFLFLAAATAQTSWTDVSNAVHPSARYGSSMVFDGARQQFLLFGGHDDVSRFDDTWTLTGSTWLAASPAARPLARRWHAMAYDQDRNVTVLFGGDGTGRFLADTWEFDGTDWLQRHPAHGPSARANHAMAYDARLHRTILVGGAAGTATWLYDGNDWTSLPVGPSPRSYSAMACDSGRGLTVLFGGKDFATFATLGDTWEFDGSNWSQRAGPMPAARYGHALAYDAQRECVVLAGGRDTVPTIDTFEYRSTGWVARNGQVRNTQLGNHFAPAMACGNGVTALFGGGTFPGVLADTRLYGPDVLARYEAAGPGCDTAVLRGLPDELPYAGQTFWREVVGNPAGRLLFFAISLTAQPTPLQQYGMAGCTLVPQGPTVNVLAPRSTTAALSLAIPSTSTLAGVDFYDQAFILRPGANALGMTLTNAMHGTIELP